LLIIQGYILADNWGNEIGIKCKNRHGWYSKIMPIDNYLKQMEEQ